MPTTAEARLKYRPGEPMTREDIEILVGGMIRDAQDYIESDVAPRREKATDYYHGEPFGNEERGRSKVVMTDVANAVDEMLPSLLRIFFGSSEHVLEFRPYGNEDEPIAKQQTDFVRYIVTQDNPGFLVFHSAFKDAMIRMLGIVKYWVEDKEIVKATEHSGLSEDDLTALAAEEGVEISLVEEEADGLFSATVTRKRTEKRFVIAALPPESLLWNRGARSLEQARIVVHTDEVMVSDLLAMGYTYEELDDAIGLSTYLQESAERQARRPQDSDPSDDELQHPLTRPIRYDEAYVYLDADGDGVGLYKLCFVGDESKLIGDINRWDHRPFAIFPFDPEPHEILGNSLADKTMDLQDIDSAVMRGTLDSLAQSLIQRTEVLEGAVNMKDLLNNEMGGVVRVQTPNAMREIAHRFVGGDTLPLLEYIGQIKEDRIGRMPGGIDADALQSSTKAAVAATLSSAQQRLELVARIFAETGMTQLFKGLLRLVVQHQDHERVVRLRNEYVTIDPRPWDADKDVIVNVGLGFGTTEEKVQVLGIIASKQEQILATMPVNPMVNLAHYGKTLGRLVEMGGYRNTEEFVHQMSQEEAEQFAAQMQQQSQQQPQDPATAALAQAEMLKAQAQVQRSQAEIQLKAQELQLKEQEMALRDDRERDKQAAEMVLRLAELELKYKGSIDREQIDAAIKRERALLDAVTRREAAQIAADAQRDIARIQQENDRDEDTADR